MVTRKMEFKEKDVCEKIRILCYHFIGLLYSEKIENDQGKLSEMGGRKTIGAKANAMPARCRY